jgi:hypothetical protein
VIYYQGLETKSNMLTDFSTTSNNNKSYKKEDKIDTMNMLGPLPKSIEQVRNEIFVNLQSNIENEMKNLPTNKEENIGESDSAPSEDNMDKEEIKKLLPAPFKKKKKIKKSNKLIYNTPSKQKLYKENKVVTKMKKDDKLGNSVQQPNVLQIKKGSTPMLVPQREKIQIQSLENEQLSISLKKETINVNTKIDKQLNLMNLMKSLQPLYVPKKIDREIQTEEIFFSL